MSATVRHGAEAANCSGIIGKEYGAASSEVNLIPRLSSPYHPVVASVLVNEAAYIQLAPLSDAGACSPSQILSRRAGGWQFLPKILSIARRMLVFRNSAMSTKAVGAATKTEL